jgi:protein-serine/threonine kinase
MSTRESHRQAIGSESENPAQQDQPRALVPAEFQSRSRTSTSGPVCNAPQPTTTTSSPWSGHNASHYPPRSLPFPALHIHTDFPPVDRRPVTPLNDNDPPLRQSLSATSLPRRTGSYPVRGNTLSSNGSLSPSSIRSSAISSPALAAMADITPLPSPIGYLSPTSWRSGGRTVSSHSLSRTSSSLSRSGSFLNLRLSDSNQLLRTASSRSRSRRYSSTRLTGSDVRESELDGQDETRGHSRNRSLSEHIPKKEVTSFPRPDILSRTNRASELSSTSRVSTSDSNSLHREQYLGVQRGLTLSAARPPTPPRSTRSGDEDADSNPIIQSEADNGSQNETYFVRSIRTKQPRKYRKLRQLGHGTFSQVSLAVRIPDDVSGKDGHFRMPSLMSQKLVAVKIIEYGPAGGADEERVEVSLKREVEILNSINHPSLVQLKAFGSDDKRALLVLDYCPGGDLFEFATSDMKSLMSPPLIRRMLAELVGAVRYLHANFIVHRDIKLESKLPCFHRFSP